MYCGVPRLATLGVESKRDRYREIRRISAEVRNLIAAKNEFAEEQLGIHRLEHYYGFL